MTPNFALSLSFEGITLLRHMGGVWARIADVALDTPDLESAVIGLREQALALDPDGGKVALIIPNEQIRYLDTPDPGGDAGARETAIRAALDGATPYAVDDLVFDYAQDRGRLLVAAVARETLDEAEGFAGQHGFSGVSFAAIAPVDSFKGAVHFGKVKGWKGRVKRLPEAILVVPADDAALTPVQPEPAVPPKPAEPPQAPAQAEAPEPAAQPEAPAQPEPQDLPEAASAQPEPEQAPETPIVADKAKDAPEQPQPDAAPQFEFSLPDPVPEPEKPAPMAAPQQPAPAAEAPDPKPAATSDAAPAKSPDPAPAAKAPDEADLGANLYFSTIRAALAADDAPTPEAPRPEVKARFTPLVEPQTPAKPEAPDEASKPAPAPVNPAPAVAPKSTVPPKPVDGPKIGGIPAQPPGAKELTARERAVALAARTPETESSDAPALPGAPQRRFTPARTPDAAIKDAAVTSGRIETDDDAPRKGGAMGAAMRFLSGRKKDDPKPEAKPAATPAIAAPSPKPVLPKAPVAPQAPALSGSPQPSQPAAAKPDTLSAKAMGAMAAMRGASLNKPAPAPEPQTVATPAAKPAGMLGRIASFRAGKGEKLGETPAKPASKALTKPIGKPAAGGAAVLSREDEAARMTIFGARNQPVGGKPRFLGLMLTAALLLFLAGVAAWASVFLQDGLASLFRKDPAQTEAIASLDPAAQSGASAALDPNDDAGDEEEDIQLAALEATPDAGQTAPALAQPAAPQTLTPEQAAATYAATGIWQRAPSAPLTPPEDNVDEVYAVSIDPDVQELDAIALPNPLNLPQEPGLADPGLPPPAGMVFDFDERGLVRATPEGALTPEGLRIFTGLPPAVPPLRAAAPAPQPVDPGSPAATGSDANPLSRVRPETRPDDIIEQRERATQTGISRTELAGLRPVRRPQGLQEQAEVAEPDRPATEQAVQASLVPVTRPRNMSALVERAERRQEQQEQQEVRTASAAAVAPRTVQPSGSTGGSVAQAATVRNAINLGKVSLVGIFGTPSNRRALVRLPSGAYKKVKIGDSVDGGRVAAIGESELRYVKSGRNVVLKMPRG
ncbi:hypothetical protein [Tropicibacter oceani]|uniref:Translation initiation factor 2 n=1 Tax=Tropicibacter oceani TaxID=3058420 RepID=A0ABY8QEL9_9RHOB|nr:hypothetical protein [Tropicibacter oceani]WGW02232.1 hypothetical protein QF118_09680 [Tropicibacter oceani]